MSDFSGLSSKYQTSYPLTIQSHDLGEALAHHKLEAEVGKQANTGSVLVEISRRVP